MLMKNLHSLAWTYSGAIHFSWVDINTDPDLIAYTLGIDTLNPAFFPCFVLVNGDSVYIAPKKATHSYFNIAQFIEETYKTEALTVWPLYARVGSFGFLVK